MAASASENPTPIRVAQAIGILGTIYSAGGSMSIAGFMIPAIRQSPTPILLSQFRQMYRRGSNSAPPIAVVTATALAYVAYHFRLTSAWKQWALASALSISIIPFTFVVIYPTIRTLEGWDDTHGEGIDRKDVIEVISAWNRRHIARSSLSLLGGLLALYALIH
ncbi:unnamed protein product [Blumeria hordei]|uniref:DUF1772-domain-containing protein n=2 Tax=Blumeria hordei TaxID=2867405 RepID=A0A383UX84_BLUHO|nr:DUF1772 family protein [Blumeria hordei DH14]SZF04356.1 unnamed protein product [Blumeria hordei]